MLNRPLTLEERVRTPDAAGGFRDSWVAKGLLWAELKAGTGREARRDFTTVARAPYRITVRAAPYDAPSRPKADQRFKDGNRIFTILAVVEAGTDGRYLTCNAVEEIVK